MNAPVLTVRYNGPPRTFAAGNDVVVGRDLRADVRIAHPLVSRAHLVLRFGPSKSGGSRWIAVDNGSLNGMYVHGRRVQEVDIADGTTVNIGNPDGPPLTFEVGRHQGSAGRPPQTSTVLIDQPTQRHPGWAPPTQPYPPPTLPPYRPPVPPPCGGWCQNCFLLLLYNQMNLPNYKFYSKIQKPLQMERLLEKYLFINAQSHHQLMAQFEK